MKLDINFREYLPQLADQSIEQLAENLLIGVLEPENIDLVIRFIVQSAYRFSPEQLPKLRTLLPDIKYGEDQRLNYAHSLARRGYRFTVQDLLQMGNPADSLGRTVAHHMVESGHVFSVDELIRLGNPGENNGDTLAHWMALQGYAFSMNELIEVGNPINHFGFSVADEMARAGHNFTLAELIALDKLAEPKKVSGNIAFAMARNGYRFSTADIEFLGNPTIRFGNRDVTLGDYATRNSPLYQPTRPLFQLKHAEGGFFFAIKDEHGGGQRTGTSICVDFGELINREFFAGHNRFVIALESIDDGWHAKISEVENTDPYYYWIERIAVDVLIEEINNALADFREFDFTQYIDWFKELHDEYFETSARIVLGS